MIIMIRKKKLLRLTSLAAVLAVAIAGLGVTSKILDKNAVSTSADGNWGLSFQQAGQPPVANATADYLKKFEAYYAEDTKEKVLYLTFDAGYENGNTAKILDALKKHQAPAAFFLVGNYLKTSPELVKRMVKEGHIVGNHTFHHPDMSQISTMETFQKIGRSGKIVSANNRAGNEKVLSPAQGRYSEKNLEMAKKLGYHTIFWSLAYVDWYESQQPTREEAFKKLIPRVHPGAIVLLHSTSRTNAQILDELLTKWEELGIRFARWISWLRNRLRIPKPIKNGTACSRAVSVNPAVYPNRSAVKPAADVLPGQVLFRQHPHHFGENRFQRHVAGFQDLKGLPQAASHFVGADVAPSYVTCVVITRTFSSGAYFWSWANSSFSRLSEFRLRRSFR